MFIIISLTENVKKKDKDVNSSGVHGSGCGFGKLSCEILVNLICCCFNIKKNYLNFFKNQIIFLPCIYVNFKLELHKELDRKA